MSPEDKKATAKEDAALIALVDELRKLSQAGAKDPVATLQETQRVLTDIRMSLGKQVAAIFNQWEGMRWKDSPESQTIGSMMDAIASKIGLSFQIESHVGRLRCIASGRDMQPTFRLACLEEDGRQICRASSRTLFHTDLVDSPPDRRRKIDQYRKEGT